MAMLRTCPNIILAIEQDVNPNFGSLRESELMRIQNWQRQAHGLAWEKYSKDTIKNEQIIN